MLDIYDCHSVEDCKELLAKLEGLTNAEYGRLCHLPRSEWFFRTDAIPFFTLAYMREERFSEDGVNVNAYTDDVEESMKRVLISSCFRFDLYWFNI